MVRHEMLDIMQEHLNTRSRIGRVSSRGRSMYPIEQDHHQQLQLQQPYGPRHAIRYQRALSISESEQDDSHFHTMSQTLLSSQPYDVRVGRSRRPSRLGMPSPHPGSKSLDHSSSSTVSTSTYAYQDKLGSHHRGPEDHVDHELLMVASIHYARALELRAPVETVDPSLLTLVKPPELSLDTGSSNDIPVVVSSLGRQQDVQDESGDTDDVEKLDIAVTFPGMDEDY